MLTMEKAKDYKELSVMAAERIAMKLSKKPNAVLACDRFNTGRHV